MNSCEIKKVNNGFMVMPTMNQAANRMICDGEINVFKTLEEVKSFLLKVMKDPEIK